MSTIAYTFEARFAGVPLEIVQWTEDIGRTVVRHTPARGDGAQLSDRGRVPREYQLSIRLTGRAEEVASKRTTLVSIAESSETRVFEHPLDGVLRCKLEAFQGSVGPGDVSFSMTLVEDLAFAERFAERPIAITAIQDVEITAAEFETALLGLALASDIPDTAAAVEAAQSWPTRAQSDIVADVEAFREAVRDVRAELDRSSEVEYYIASVRLEALRATYEQYAQAVNSQRAAVFDLVVGRPQPLIVLLSALYGAAIASGLVDEVARINDIPDASRLEPGTALSLPAVTG